MKEDESLRVERETAAYRSTRKRQADAKRHVERHEPSRSEGLNCNEPTAGLAAEPGKSALAMSGQSTDNAGTRLKRTGPGCGTGHATAHGPRHAAPGPDRTAVPLAPHSGREHARRGNRPAHRGVRPPPRAPRPGELSGLRSFPPSPELTTCDDSILHTITT